MDNTEESDDGVQYGKHLRVTVAASQGGRRYMEDRFLVHTERNPDKSIRWVFLGVFDGHGGEHASEYVRRNLLDNIRNHEKFDSPVDKEFLAAIREGFLTTHEMMRDVHEEWPYTASGYPSTAGTTVSCAFIRNGKVYTGHVGDSSIVLGVCGDGDVKAYPLTIDHKPESATEQLRIQKSGGTTAVKSGVTRVVWRRPVKGHQYGPIKRTTPTEMIPFLSVARSLGDLWSYNRATDCFIVSPDPDVDVYELGEQDFCLVLASDGLTNVMTPDQSVSIVYKEEEVVEANSDVNRNHARCLLRAALAKWRTLRADNVTVAAVIFDSEPTHYQDTEVLMRLGAMSSVDQAITDKPDSMLHITDRESVVLCTQRTPVIYNGSKDINFCRVMYRGPGFRTHEEEIQAEERNILMSRREFAGIQFHDDDDIEYDDDEEYEDDDVNVNGEVIIPMRVGNEMRMTSRSLSGRIVETKFVERIVIVPSPQRPPRPSAPEPFSPSMNASTHEPDEGTDEEDLDMSLTPSKRVKKASPSKTPSGNTVRRIKAEAHRRLRTPKIKASPPELEKRVTRSATKASENREQDSVPLKKLKSTDNVVISPSKANRNLNGRASSTPNKRTLRSDIVTPNNSETPKELGSVKTSQSRKRGRCEMLKGSSSLRKTTGVTPVVKALSIGGDKPPPTPSRSAPSTPKKSESSNNTKGLRASKWSLSKLDTPKPSTSNETIGDDGIVRMSENADDYEDDDTIAEPPSKMRRIYGFMKRLVGWQSSKQ